ncbi:ribose import ATP-binding protein RbsA [Maritalea myrionectae]|uniref:Ribose import ATP-binding protein RbsA n=1 Tax=Maritalea myrionectae TaxID=454601 RepID=A0A2R4MHC8_9HYPH|nr:ABC transporter ATP-binding protein [Maritalea myrionectae]AVX05461.1 ribose import ATP-binding protein RbsA [Maritalea myrionectae]
MSNILLSIKDIEVFYGPSQALFGVSLEVKEGEVVALMGRNGMGKTTTIRTLCKMSKPTKGDIHFDGTLVNKMPSHKVAKLGVGLVPEGRRCFANLTVEENLVAAQRDGEWTLEKVYQLFPRLEERKDQLANTLSGGEQQMLAIGRALTTNPKLLVLDEATEGLAPVIREEIWRAVKALKAQGQSILIVDKSLSELLPIADHCVILERGETVWTGTPDALTDDLADRYLGV